MRRLASWTLAPTRMTATLLYRYGRLTWIWRTMGAAALLAAGGLGVLAARTGGWWLLAVALPLTLPVIALFPMVATRIELVPHGGGRATEALLRIGTLAGITRHVPCSAVKGFRYRDTAATESGQIRAPRVWVLVRAGMPVYVDLLADIQDRASLGVALGLPAYIVRQGGG